MIKFEFVLSYIFGLFIKIVQYMVSQIKEIEIFYHLAKNYFVFILHIDN